MINETDCEPKLFSSHMQKLKYDSWTESDLKKSLTTHIIIGNTSKQETVKKIYEKMIA